MNTKWLKACGIRAIKTFCQTLAAYLATASMLSEISWQMALSSAGLSAILSICTSVATGLPEVDMTEKEAE